MPRGRGCGCGGLRGARADAGETICDSAAQTAERESTASRTFATVASVRRARALIVVGLLAACGADLAPGDHEITRRGQLLGSDGRLREPGWARQQLLDWNPERVADPERLRQWDFVSFQDAAAAVNVTIFDLGFVQLASISLIDLATNEKLESATVRLSQTDRFQLSPALLGRGVLQLDGEPKPAVAIETLADHTTVDVHIAAPLTGSPAQGSFVLTRRPAQEYLSLASPFVGEPDLFFFEQKVPGLLASGSVTIGARTVTFEGAPGVIDWGRGAWPAKATWRWAGASGTIDGVPVALNLGEGFADATYGTENLVVIGDRVTKLGRVAWTFDPSDLSRPWRFGQSATLTPMGQETGGLDFGDRYNRLTKIYGLFSGSIALPDGTVQSLDGLRGFAEQMELSW